MIISVEGYTDLMLAFWQCADIRFGRVETTDFGPSDIEMAMSHSRHMIEIHELLGEREILGGDTHPPPVPFLCYRKGDARCWLTLTYDTNITKPKETNLLGCAGGLGINKPDFGGYRSRFGKDQCERNEDTVSESLARRDETYVCAVCGKCALADGNGWPFSMRGAVKRGLRNLAFNTDQPIGRTSVFDGHEGSGPAFLKGSGSGFADQKVIAPMARLNAEPNQDRQDTKASKDQSCFQGIPREG